MKPKNRVMCPDCGKQKMLFDSQKEAENFIKFNGKDINTHGGQLRVYYCPACCGYHISSKKHKASYDHSTERLIGAYRQNVKDSSINRLIDEAFKSKQKEEEYKKLTNLVFVEYVKDRKYSSPYMFIKKEMEHLKMDDATAHKIAARVGNRLVCIGEDADKNCMASTLRKKAKEYADELKENFNFQTKTDIQNYLRLYKKCMSSRRRDMVLGAYLRDYIKDEEIV